MAQEVQTMKIQLRRRTDRSLEWARREPVLLVLDWPKQT